MVSIKTQLSSAGLINTSPLPIIKANDSTLRVSDNAGSIKSTTLTLSDDLREEYSAPSDPEKGGYDPSIPSFVFLKTLSGDDQSAIWNKERMEFHQAPTFSADAALTKINRELTSIQHKIEAVKPDLLGKKWDFVLKGEKIEATGTNLTIEEKQWLENTLNRNKTVQGAVKDFYAAVIKSYEHTEDHPSSFNTSNGKDIFAYGVGEQIDGKLQIKSIMDQVVSKLGNSVPNNAHPFIKSLEVAGSYLKVTTEATYIQSNADLSDPTTAAYMKEHPNQRV